MSKMEPGEEKENLEEKLDEIKEKYNDIVERTNEKKEQLDTAVPLAQKFTEDSAPFKTWLDETEEGVKKFEHVPLNEDELDRVIKETKVCSTLIS